MLTRLALVAALSAVPAAGCAKKTAPTTVVVVDDTPKDKGGGAAAPGGAQDESLPEVSVGTVARKPPAGKPVHVRAALHGVGDLFALIKQTTAAWTPKQPIDPAAQIQAILLQLGYGPGLWSNLDLAGPFTVDATFPYQDPGSDLKLVGSLAALSAKGVMDGMPSSQRPQPLGGGVWELIQGEMRVYLREQSKALEFALGIADLDRAGPLVAEAGKGRRLQLRAWDMPQGMLGNLNLGLPAGLGRQLDAVLRDTKSAALEVDAGTDRDLTLQVSAEAPFARLGLSPLGPARNQPTALEALLPSAPALVVALPWGNPEVLHAMLDKNVRLDQIPAPFDKVAKDALQGAHGLLDQVTGDVVFALYVGAKGETTAVIAANVKDEAAARAAARSVTGAASKGLEAFNQLTGEDKAAKIGVTFKADGVKAGAVKADLLAIAVPKNMEKEVDSLSPFLTKKKLEAVTLVSGQLAVLAVGGAAEKLVADVGGGLKSGRKTSLSSDAGLRLARQSSQGCHFCVSVDPPALLRLAALVDPDGRKDKVRLGELDAAAATFTRIGGAVGLGLKLDPGLGGLGLGLPKSVLVLSPADAVTLGKLWGDRKPAPEDKPLSGPIRIMRTGAAG